MTSANDSDRLLVQRVRGGDAAGWQELIDRYEGRLLAFLRTRIGSSDQAEEVVQETLIGFMRSLPNYDASQSLEGYLFSIAAHKLTDHLRREGRRPTVSLNQDSSSNDSSGGWDVPGSVRGASSLFRSQERREQEETALVAALREQFQRFAQRGEWTKLKCLELLCVCGWGNKDAAQKLGLSEQQVANYKFEFLDKLRASMARQGLRDIPGLEG